MGTLPYGFAFADLDGDGDTNAAVINQQGDSLTVLMAGPGGALSLFGRGDAMRRKAGVKRGPSGHRPPA